MATITEVSRVSFWDSFTLADSLQVPDPITFAIGERWLDRPNLYPRQATLLKIIFLRDDLFTVYDHQVIDEWIGMFRQSNPDAGPENKWRPKTNGIQPDIYERIAWLKERGYRWFKEVILAIGRRGSKGYISSIAMAYVLWNYLTLGDPQGFYGIDRDKQLAIMIFAGKKEQAKQNLWGDLNNIILGSNCYAPYVSQPLAESLSLYVPNDFERIKALLRKGIRTAKDMASLGVLPRESTLLAARGPAGAVLGFDEAAHVKNAGTTREFGDIYKSARPALDQFGKDGFIIIPSSTWEMTTYFYALWEQALEQEPDDMGILHGVYPNKLMLQLGSWDPYIDWEIAHELPLFPHDFQGDLGEYAEVRVPRLQPLRSAIQAFDEEMAKEERANPDTFAVERRSYWATSLDAYLNPGKVEAMFLPWEDRPEAFGRPHLEMRSKGPMTILYRAHGDPANVNCRFGFAMAHTEPGPDGYLHAVFDLIKFWDPADWEDHFVDYDEVTDWIYDYVIRPFLPGEITFDQFNVPSTVKRLQKKVHAGRLPKRVQVYERDATPQLNWKTWECFKGSLNMGWVHAPAHPEGELELKFVQKPEGQQKVLPPDSGPVVTKDIADCIAIVTADLLGEQMAAFLGEQLSGQRPAGGMHTAQTDPMNRFDPMQASGNPLAQQLGGTALARGARPGSMPLRLPGATGQRQMTRMTPSGMRRRRS